MCAVSVSKRDLSPFNIVSVLPVADSAAANRKANVPRLSSPGEQLPRRHCREITRQEEAWGGVELGAAEVRGKAPW